MNEEAIGQMLAIPDDVVAKLEVFGYPKFLNEEVRRPKDRGAVFIHYMLCGACYAGY